MPRSNFGGKKNFLQNFIFYHSFEFINFQPAGFHAFKEKSGPLLHPYIYSHIQHFRWQTFSMPEHGAKNPKDLVERIQTFLTFTIPLVGLTMTQVYRCDLVKVN